MSVQASEHLSLKSLPLEGIEPDRSPYDRVAIFCFFLLALGLRLPGLRGDLWIDEIAALEFFVRLPLSQIISTYSSANNHVLYSILAHISIALFGETEGVLRLPALLFGAATVPALYYLACSVTCRREAFAATFLLAVSYHHTYFSQSARGYTGYLFFSVLSTAFLIRALSSDGPRYWVGFVLTTVANLYIHLNGLFFLAGQAGGTLILYAFPRTRRAGRRLLLHRLLLSLGAIVLLAGALYAPIIVSIFTLFTTSSWDVGWPLSFALLKILLRDTAPGAAGLFAVMLALPVVLVGLVSIMRTAPLLLYVMFLPLLFGLSVVVVMGGGTYPRFFLILLPFGLLVAVRGLHVVAEWGARWLIGDAAPNLLARRAFVLFVLLAAAGAASGLPRLYTLPKQAFRASIQYLEAERKPDEIVIVIHLAEKGYRYYGKRFGLKEGKDYFFVRSVEALEAVLSSHDGKRSFLVTTLSHPLRINYPDLDARIAKDWVVARTFPGTIGDGEITIWKQPPP